MIDGDRIWIMLSPPVENGLWTWTAGIDGTTYGTGMALTKDLALSEGQNKMTSVINSLLNGEDL